MSAQTEWQGFINRLQSGLSDVKQNVDAIINDGSATDAQKQQAASDYAKQSLFLQQVQGMYDNGDYDNPTNTYNVKGTGAVYLSYKDSKYHSLTLAPWVYNGAITEGDTITAQVMMSDEISLVSTLEDIWSGTKTVTGEEIQRVDGSNLYIGCTFGVGAYGTGFHATLVDANDYFSGVDLAQYTRGPQGVFAGVYIPSYSGAPQSALIRDTFSGTTQSRGYWSSGSGIYAGYATIIEIQPEDAENPWDYYNDNVLPTIADTDRQAIPGGYSPVPVRPDPEDPGDEETGGDDYDPNDPSTLGGGFGFTTQYALRASHLSEIGQILWKGFADLQNYIDNFVYRVDPATGSMNMEDIMQYFISLRAYPCPISALASTSPGGYDLYIGSGAVPLTLTTPISVVNSFIGYINAGDLSLPYWFGDFRDYDLNVTVNLPYCGTAELNPGDVMGGTLHCFYYVDLCTGACTGYVTCDTWEGSTILVASIPGQLGADVPLTATNSGRVMSRMYGDRINAVSNLVDAAKAAVTGIGAIMSGNPAGAIRQGFAAFIDPAINDQKMLAEQAGRAAIAAPVLSSGKGFASFGTSKTAYVQVRSPIYAAPDNYAESVGVPSSSAVQIGDCSGFCQFVNVDVSGITTDAADQAAIRQALSAGIII